MRKLLLVLGAIVGAVYLVNASWRVGGPERDVRLIAHRGVHQSFHREGLTNETCTAERIDPPRHDYLENTIPSMQAAFAAGADVVELDVHPTVDGRFAVLHDWTVDCRTDGKGVTREQTAAYLKGLDIGYGYTADGGRTFPFRGKGRGSMPMLDEVLGRFPGGRFLINHKSNEESEGPTLASLIDAHPQWRKLVWGAYGGDAPTLALAERLTGIHAWTRRGLIDCLGRYVALGWSGYVPQACRDATVMLPINVAPWLWGWPNLFQKRMQAAGTEIILLGPYKAGDPGTSGVDTPEDLARVPDRFSGYVWTNRIEAIGPLLDK